MLSTNNESWVDFKMTHKQRTAYQHMILGNNVFITGGGGVGKSALLKYFYNSKTINNSIIMTSLTGTSAVLIGGATIHSYLGLGLGVKSVDALCTKIKSKQYLKKRWIALKTLIIDEISMMSAELFDKISNIAKIIKNSERPFGGIQIIASGDFCQLKPIGSDNFCFEASDWEPTMDYIVNLTEIIRQKDVEFQNCLNDIRLGTIKQSTKDLLEQHIGKKLSNEQNIIPTKLFSTNDLVDKINNKSLSKLENKSKTSETLTYDVDVEITNRKGLTKDIVEYLTDRHIKSITAPETINICMNCQVMLCVNLDAELGLVNGSRGVVIGFINDLPHVKFLNGTIMVIDWYSWDIETDDGKKIGKVSQIPLRLAYAFSIHKSQGCTLDYAVIDLSNIFDYGMAYVALSRIKSLENLSITAINWERIETHPKALEFYRMIEE